MPDPKLETQDRDQVTAVQASNQIAPGSLESRSRMVSFRLSSEEYDRFRDLCFTNGTRSVSEMARAAIRLMLQQSNGLPQDGLETRVTDLESRLHLLALEVKSINRQISVTNQSNAQMD